MTFGLLSDPILEITCDRIPIVSMEGEIRSNGSVSQHGNSSTSLGSINAFISALKDSACAIVDVTTTIDSSLCCLDIIALASARERDGTTNESPIVVLNMSPIDDLAKAFDIFENMAD